LTCFRTMLRVPLQFEYVASVGEVTPTVQAQRAAIQLARVQVTVGSPGRPTNVIAATAETDLAVASPSSRPIGLTDAEAVEGASTATARARVKVRFMS